MIDCIAYWPQSGYRLGHEAPCGKGMTLTSLGGRDCHGRSRVRSSSYLISPHNVGCVDLYRIVLKAVVHWLWGFRYCFLFGLMVNGTAVLVS